jgi:hypothetical protein
MTYIPSLGGRLKLGAGWCNTPSPVLRGAGNESLYDRDIVAPPGNQAETEKTNVCLTGDENPAYSPVLAKFDFMAANHSSCKSHRLSFYFKCN